MFEDEDWIFTEEVRLILDEILQEVENNKD